MTSAARDQALPRLGLFLLAFLTLIWGINWPIMKIALTEVPPWTFRALCTIGGGLGLLVLTRLGGASLAVPLKRLPLLVLVALLNITGWTMFSAFGVSMMAAGRASIIAFTMPLWGVFLSAVFLREPLTLRRLAGLALGLAGLALLIGGDVASMKAAPLGALCMLAAALSWAAGTVVLKRIAWNASVIALTVWQLLIGGIPLVLGALFWDAARLGPVGTGPALAVLYNVGVCFLFGNYAWFKIVSLFPAGVAGISSMMIPVVGVLSAALVLGEPLGYQELGALVLVVTALGAVLTARVPAPRAPIAG